jgi:hypothetical protein
MDCARETETDMMAEFWKLDNPLLPGFKARSGLEAIKARAGEIHVQPGPRTFAEIEQIINHPSS